MAGGLYHLAAIDGVTESERELLGLFLKDGGVDMDLDALARIPFSLEGLMASLDTAFLRKTFLKVALLTARADGTVSDAEAAELRRVAQALGIDESIDAMLAGMSSSDSETVFGRRRS
jgi:hypothetical protein